MEQELITSRVMRALELNAEYFGISQLQLMENAGRAVADAAKSRFRSLKTRIVVFCGLGGNGGDGLVAARHLVAAGYKVEVILAGRPSEISHEAARKNWEAFHQYQEQMPIYEVYDSSLIPDTTADVIIDALLGIGAKGEPRPPIKQLIHLINRLKVFRIAVDVPSGLDADSGKAFGEAVKADLTITFHKAKPGLLKAERFVGELKVADIGLPHELKRFAGPGDVGLVVKPRAPEAHKGDFGRLLVVGGSDVYSGAPAYVALAALRTGVDLAYIAAPERTAYNISAYSPNLITVKLSGTHLRSTNISSIEPFLSVATALAIGPGLGLHDETKEAVRSLLASVERARRPLLLDADGLKAFGGFKRRLKVPVVFTPHAGEYNALVGHFPPDDLDAKVEDVRRSAQEIGGVILLKGNTDVISDGTRVKLNFTGNPGMTVGGTGDVLSGIVAAFLSQGVDAFEAAVAGAFINGACGDFVRREKGFHLVATDLIDWIPRMIDNPMSHIEVRRPR
jgi:NAD(P)H-hydrate epimerase